MSQQPKLTPKLRSKQPTTKKVTDDTGFIVLAILLVFVVFIFMFIFYSIKNDANAPDVINRCGVGLCAFDIITGIKRCPEPGATVGLRIAAGAEKCTTRDYCQSSGFTCAVQLDQSLNCDGVCGPGNEKCRCIADPTR